MVKNIEWLLHRWVSLIQASYNLLADSHQRCLVELGLRVEENSLVILDQHCLPHLSRQRVLEAFEDLE